MIDSGATALFVHDKFVRKHHIAKFPLKHEITVRNIDGTQNKAGKITHFAKLTIKLGGYEGQKQFLITDVRPKDMILGLPWLKEVNPNIDWTMGEMEVPDGSDTPSNSPNTDDSFTPSLHQIDANRAERRQWLRAGIIEDTSDEVWILYGYSYSTEIAAKENIKKYNLPLPLQ